MVREYLFGTITDFFFTPLQSNIVDSGFFFGDRNNYCNFPYSMDLKLSFGLTMSTAETEPYNNFENLAMIKLETFFSECEQSIAHKS